MKKFLLSIWKDPVLSKVIAGFIIFICAGVWSYFNWEKTKLFFTTYYNKFINLNIPLYYILLLLLLIWLLSKLGKNIQKKVIVPKVKSKEEIFRRNDHKYLFEKENILCRYGVTIGFDGKPFVHNLKIYCNYHTPARELIGGHCSIIGCNNQGLNLYNYNVESLLNDDIIHKWEQYDLDNK